MNSAFSGSWYLAYESTSLLFQALSGQVFFSDGNSLSWPSLCASRGIKETGLESRKIYNLFFLETNCIKWNMKLIQRVRGSLV